MRREIYFVFLFVTIAIIILFPLLLDARAGGGHSFGGSSGGHSSGGGHSGHSSSGHSSGGGHIGGGGGDILWLIILLIEYPYIGVPVVIGGIIFFYFMGRGANNYRINSTIRKANSLSESQMKMIKSQNLLRIKEIDPHFSEEKFLERVKNAFMIVQKSWSEQNLEPMRPFVSNGIMNRFAIQIDMQKAEGYRNRLSDIEIISTDIMGVTSDNLYDRIDVAFSVLMNDTDVDLKTGKVLRENESSFTEYWTFLRRRGAKSQDKDGLIEGRCPNCGGIIKITESGNCEYCKAFVSGGQYDWVLTEITQEEEYESPYQQVNIVGLDEMMKKDLDFNIAVIEDKVSVIFFKMVRTNYFGDIRYIKEIAHPNFYNSLSGIFNPSNEWYQSINDVAVGAVEVKRITINNQDGYDKIDVMVRWSASYCERNRKTKEVRNIQEKSIRTQTYTIIRKSDVKTKSMYNFKTIPCRSCGAPLSTNIEDRCDYCGAIVNDGSRDWVLYSVDIYRPYNFQTQYTGVIKSKNENQIMIQAMAASMLADGVINEREKEMIYTAAQNRGIPKGLVDQIIESARRGEAIAIPSNLEEARGMLSSMARVALSDGKISGEEYNLLLRFGEKFNYRKADIDVIINTQRKLLFQEARDFIKRTKVE